MPAPSSADTGTLTVPVVAVSGVVYDGRKNSPVAGSIRPGWETTSTGLVAPVSPVRSYVTGIADPVTTGGAIGAWTLCTVPSQGPNVRVELACAITLPLLIAW